MWQYLVIGLGLVFVLEGIMPFVSPDRYRRFLLRMAEQSPKSLRTVGLVMMIIGLGIVVAMQHFYGV